MAEVTQLATRGTQQIQAAQERIGQMMGGAGDMGAMGMGMGMGM